MPDSSDPAAIGISVSSSRLRAVRLDEQKTIVKKFETELSRDASVAEQNAAATPNRESRDPILPE